MAKISELPQATSLNGNEIIPIVSIDENSASNLSITIRMLVDNIMTIGDIDSTETIRNEIATILLDNIDSQKLEERLSNKSDVNHDHDVLYANQVHTHNYYDLENLPEIPNISQADFERLENQILNLEPRIASNEDSLQAIVELLDAIISNGNNGGGGTETGHSHNNLAILETITTNKIIEWDSKSNFSGSYNDLTDKPSIPTSLPANGGNADTVNGFKIEVLTQSEYDNLQVKTKNTIYMIKEG